MSKFDELLVGMGWPDMAYSNNNPINYNDPTGHMASVDDGGSCVGLNCKKTALSNNSKKTSLDSLIAMFTTDSLPGENCIERLDSIYNKTAKVTGLLYTKGDYDDSGFKEEYQDPWPSSDNQVGHFITAVKYGEYSIKYPEMKSLALAAITGHEMIGDNFQIISNIAQVAVGVSHTENFPLFESGKDSAFSEILNSYNLPPKMRKGNSIQDLRLSYAGWTFAQSVYSGELVTREQCTFWIEHNLGN